MKTAAWFRRMPWSVVVIAVSVVCLGWLAIHRCEELTAGSGQFLHRQMFYSVLGLAVMLAVSIPNYRVLCRWSYLLFLLSLALLMVVYCFPAIHSSHRWIRVGPVGVQPSEFAKVAFVLALARYLMYRENYRRLRGLVLPLAIALLPILLILKEPDLGTAAVFLPVLFVMLFAAGARRGDLARIALIGLMVLPLLWMQMSREQQSRVTALFEQPAADQRPSDDAYHLHQAKRMLAMGGVWGSYLTGPLTDDVAAYRLPEARSDFIFSVLGERFGLLGVGAVLAMFGLLIWRGLAVAAATREPFGRLVATGVATLLAVQVLVNTAMTVGLLPVTGLPLPLISYGGSGLLAYAVALGLILNIGSRPGYEVTNEPFRYVVE